MACRLRLRRRKRMVSLMNLSLVAVSNQMGLFMRKFLIYIIAITRGHLL